MHPTRTQELCEMFFLLLLVYSIKLQHCQLGYLVFHNPPNSDMDYKTLNVYMWSSCMCIHMGMNVPEGWTNSPSSSLHCIFGQEPSRAWTCKAAFLTVLTWSYETRVGRGVPGGRFLASDLRSALQPTSMMGWVGQCSRTSGCHWNTHMQPHHKSKQFCRQSHLPQAHTSFRPARTNVCIRPTDQ